MRERVSFLEAILGLVMQPKSVTAALLRARPYPHVLGLFSALILTFLVPFAVQLYRYQFIEQRLLVFEQLSLVVILTLILFLLNQSILLRLLSIPLELDAVVTITAYSLTPPMVFLWLLYGYDFFENQHLDLVSYIVSGYGKLDPAVLSVIPICVALSILCFALTLFHSLRFAADTYRLSAIVIAATSVVPLYFSALVSVLLVDLALPGAAELISKSVPILGRTLELLRALVS